MTKEQLAALLNGREYGDEITTAEEKDAKAARLVVVFGYSDDNVELRGFINDEIGACEGATFHVSPQGLVQDWDSFRANAESEAEFQAYFAKKVGALPITANWDSEGYYWTYTTSIPHATFEIMEDGDRFCRGIVFSMDELVEKDLPTQHTEGPDHGEHLGQAA